MAPQTPTLLHRTHSIIRTNTSSLLMNSPRQQASLSASTSSIGLFKELPTPKRLLFMSPQRPTAMTAPALVNNATNEILSNNVTTTAATTNASQVEQTNAVATPNKLMPPQQPQKFLTPLNKLRGLFSAYRERLDNSPLSTSLTSPSNFVNDHNTSEVATNNRPLLDISASE